MSILNPSEPVYAQELRAWLHLVNTPGIGSRAICQLLAAFGLPEQILALSHQQLSQVLSSKSVLALQREPDDHEKALIDNTIAWASEAGNAILTLADPRYPQALLSCGDPPPLLYTKGLLQTLDKPALAIVGSRNATTQGIQNAQAFAQHLALANYAVVSGLALGIDGAAHQGALNSGQAAGVTIAVVGTGLDMVYPARHRQLAHQIAANGLLLSEYPLGAKAIPHHFPRRNRIIAGLSKGVLIVEAALHSGSLITARQAVEQGREVFAIPGSIHSPLAKGCHALIKQGAKLVESAQDILEELGTPLSTDSVVAVTANATTATPHPLLVALDYEPTSIDSLLQRCGLDAATLSAELLTLELNGQVERLCDGRYQRLG